MFLLADLIAISLLLKFAFILAQFQLLVLSKLQSLFITYLHAARNTSRRHSRKTVADAVIEICRNVLVTNVHLAYVPKFRHIETILVRFRPAIISLSFSVPSRILQIGLIKVFFAARTQASFQVIALLLSYHLLEMLFGILFMILLEFATNRIGTVALQNWRSQF